MAITRLDWASSFLKEIKAPVSERNLWALVAWQAAEGGPNGAKFNPLNTTQRWPGSTSFNSVGVQNYLTEQNGLAATAKTLLQTEPVLGYGPIVGALRDNKSAKDTLVALWHSAWGTGSGAVRILHDVKTFWDRDYAHVLIPQ